MTIKLFASERKSSGGSKPFLNVLLEAEMKIATPAKVRKKWVNQPFTVHKFVLVSSGKGALIETEPFSCFLFRNSTVFKQAIEALDFYCDSNGECPAFVVVPNDLSGGFDLGIDDEETFFISKEGKVYILSLTPMERADTSDDGNPFLLSSFGKDKETDSVGTEDTTPPKGKSTTRKRSPKVVRSTSEQ